MARISALAAQAVPRQQSVPRPNFGRSVSASTVAMLLNEGGDERLDLDSITGRTRLGTRNLPADNEIWFSSASASAITPSGFAAAAAALARILGPGGTTAALKESEITAFFDQLRTRLLAIFGIPGADAVFSASGTDAELLALSIASAVQARPLTNIVMAPEESGSGVMAAAAGRHFLSSSCLGDAVSPGTPLRGLEHRSIETQGIAIRDEDGYPRDSSAIDREAAQKVAQALAAGRDVLLHVLDSSATGLSGVTRETARALAAQARGRLTIIVDACQLRCSPARIWDDLGAGFMVTITGSKFAGGPPFAGALLLPSSITERLNGKARLPSGLSSYSAYLDWPESLRGGFATPLTAAMNLGLGLRWEASLAAIEPYFSLPESLRGQVLGWFAGAVHRRIAARPHLRQIAGEPSRSKTIIPVETAGEAATLAAALKLHAALAAPTAPPWASHAPARACHLGQPVAIGNKAVLRICSSMPLVLDIAAGMIAGETIEAAIAPVLEDLDVMFEKWDRLAGA